MREGFRINFLSRILGRFLPEQTTQNVIAGLRNPRGWLRGGDIPADHVTPWELLLGALSSAFGGMSGGFTGRQDFLFKEVYRVPANYLSVAGVISSLWDAVNDPLLGAWMDKRRFGPQALKNIMRISAFTGHTFNIIKMIDGGLSPWQHVALLMFCNMTQDIIGTLDGVAGTKIRSGISPSTQQRSRVEVWNKMGWQATWIIGNLPTLFMGFREVFKLTDYQIIFLGSLVFLPFAIASSVMPTFVKQRVDYSRLPSMGMETRSNIPKVNETSLEDGSVRSFTEPAPRGLRGIWDATRASIRDMGGSFQVVKHNRYFIFNSIANFITVFSPNVGDELLVYRYLVPSFKIFGKEMSGEGVLLFKQTISGLPSTLMQPFNRQIINRLGGPLRAQQIKSFVDAGGKLLQFFVGYNTAGKLAVMIAAETAINFVTQWDQVAGQMLNYEFFDHVELKTGERSEGVTSAVNGLFAKIITNNIGLATGNAFLNWTGYRGGYLQDGTRPPERYMKWMWPMYTLIPVLDNMIYVVCRSFVKWTPADREFTELALAERRAAVDSTRADAAPQDAETVSVSNDAE